MKERKKEETVNKVIFILLRSKQEFDQDHQVSVYGKQFKLISNDCQGIFIANCKNYILNENGFFHIA